MCSAVNVGKLYPVLLGMYKVITYEALRKITRHLALKYLYLVGFSISSSACLIHWQNV